LAGITLLLWNELGHLTGNPAGIVWMQAAAFCWALGTIWMRRAHLTLPAETLVVWMMALSSVVIEALALLLEPAQRWQFSAPVWASLVWSVLINYGAAQAIWFALARPAFIHQRHERDGRAHGGRAEQPADRGRMAQLAGPGRHGLRGGGHWRGAAAACGAQRGP
jgi:hypothetical protein